MRRKHLAPIVRKYLQKPIERKELLDTPRAKLPPTPIILAREINNANPSQWEGRTVRMKKVFAEFRGGVLKVWVEGDLVVSKVLSTPDDGYLSFTELEWATENYFEWPYECGR